MPADIGTFPGGTYTASTTQTGHLGFGERHSVWRDGIHHYTLVLDNAASSMNLRFGMTANEAIYNEAFGVDNIVVTTNALGGTTISEENFEAGPVPEWNAARWHSAPTVTTVSTGELGFQGGTSFLDGIHHYRVAIPTSATVITLGFGDALNTAADEMFGVDNIVLSETCSR